MPKVQYVNRIGIKDKKACVLCDRNVVIGMLSPLFLTIDFYHCPNMPFFFSGTIIRRLKMFICTFQIKYV